MSNKYFAHFVQPKGYEKKVLDLLEGIYGNDGYAFFYKFIERHLSGIHMDPDNMELLAEDFGMIKDVLEGIINILLSKQYIYIYNNNNYNTIKPSKELDGIYNINNTNLVITDSLITDTVDVWNSLYGVGNISKVRLPLSKERLSKLKVRLKEPDFDIEKIKTAILNQPKLHGENGNWCVNFDFVIRNGSTYQRILDNQYAWGETKEESSFEEDIVSIINYYKAEKKHKSDLYNAWFRENAKTGDNIGNPSVQARFNHLYKQRKMRLPLTFKTNNGINRLIKKYGSITGIVREYDREDKRYFMKKSYNG